MNNLLITLLTCACLFSLDASASVKALEILHLANEQNIVNIASAKRYLLLPVQDNAPEAKLYVVSANRRILGREINIRLARERVDYIVPLDLSDFAGKDIKIDVQGMPAPSVCWKYMTLSDTFDRTNREYWRPVYHHTPVYGWMNDPNGMFYKDGTYHLYYQYNPYGSTWGNMHWGHSTSKDLVTWTDERIALSPDAWGTIFSGSCVVDAENTSGFGEGAVVAFYTSAKPTPWGDVQAQSIAYSTDNGKTFVKYDNNPVVTSDLRDFRDPKVFWYAPGKHWVMVLAAGQEMLIYSSPNLKEWSYESSFGLRDGAHGGVWECPDLIEMPIYGTDEKKWVLICNINPGGPFGGSAAQYFVGRFNGKKFVNESPTVTKWLDWGKDNYATVTWSGVQDRIVAIGWMSNWQYQAQLPVMQYRGVNTIPRELELYVNDGETYIRTIPVKEVETLRKDCIHKEPFTVAGGESVVNDFLKNPDGAFEFEVKIKTTSAKESIGFILCNDNGEEVKCHYDMSKGQFVMDRTSSGKVDFSRDFPAVTVAPVNMGKTVSLRVFVDKTSVEIFGEDGKFVMTNLVFPTRPYDTIRFFATDGGYNVKSLDIYNY